MINLETLLKAYEVDAADPKGLGRFEVLNMFTNRDVIEEHRDNLTTPVLVVDWSFSILTLFLF